MSHCLFLTLKFLEKLKKSPAPIELASAVDRIHMKVLYERTAPLICRHKKEENDKSGILGKRRWLSLSSHLGNIIKFFLSAVGVPALCGSTDVILSRELGHHREPVGSPSSPNLQLKEPRGCSLTAQPTEQ